MSLSNNRRAAMYFCAALEHILTGYLNTTKKGLVMVRQNVPKAEIAAFEEAELRKIHQNSDEIYGSATVNKVLRHIQRSEQPSMVAKLRKHSPINEMMRRASAA